MRIVITGMGVVAPGAPNLAAFESLLREGRSGVTHSPEAAECGMACQVGGTPYVDETLLAAITLPPRRRAMNVVMNLAALAAIECWRDAGLPYSPGDEAQADPKLALVFGSGGGGIETSCATVGPLVQSKQVRKLGARSVEQTMQSGVAACVSGLLGPGGPVISMSAACTTGASCMVQAQRMLRLGECERVLVGAAESPTVYTWASFDAMHVLVRDSNGSPETASRPLSARANGFVPSGGAGALLLETEESATRRGARIYAELVGCFENSGGQRSGGTMSRQSPVGVERCVRGALANARIEPDEIDYINGHLTSTGGEPAEVASISSALGRKGDCFPWINSTKSLIGHTLGAAGAIESVATILQLYHGFLHPSINCEDIHPEIASIDSRVVRTCLNFRPRAALKTSFGFGDVNAALIFRPWHGHHQLQGESNGPN